MTFEDYLINVHAEKYRGLDDDMPEDFESWLTELDLQVVLEYGTQYAIAEKNKMIDEKIARITQLFKKIGDEYDTTTKNEKPV